MRRGILLYILCLSACFQATPASENPLDPDNITGLFLNLTAFGEYWQSLQMQTQRTAHTSTLLSDGRVLLAGGTNSSGNEYSSMEVFDPSTSSFTFTNATLTTATSNHSATLLSDGRVLIAGGINSSSTKLQTVYLYNPSLDSISTTTSMNVARERHRAIRLDNDKILVVGGNTAGAEAEVFNPADNSWTNITDGTIVSNWHQLAKLSDGRVLLTGGSNAKTTARIFNAAGTSSSATGALNTERFGHIALTLDNGNVLIAGSENSTLNTDPHKETELYSSGGTTFTNHNDSNFGRARSCIVKMTDGRIMIIGGIRYYLHPTNIFKQTETPTSSVEFYNNGSFSNGSSMSMAFTVGGFSQYGFRCTALNTGDVLVTGQGIYSDDSVNAGTTDLFTYAEIYRVVR